MKITLFLLLIVLGLAISALNTMDKPESQSRALVRYTPEAQSLGCMLSYAHIRTESGAIIPLNLESNVLRTRPGSTRARMYVYSLAYPLVRVLVELEYNEYFEGLISSMRYLPVRLLDDQKKEVDCTVITRLLHEAYTRGYTTCFQQARREYAYQMGLIEEKLEDKKLELKGAAKIKDIYEKYALNLQEVLSIRNSRIEKLQETLRKEHLRFAKINEEHKQASKEREGNSWKALEHKEKEGQVSLDQVKKEYEQKLKASRQMHLSYSFWATIAGTALFSYTARPYIDAGVTLLRPFLAHYMTWLCASYRSES